MMPRTSLTLLRYFGEVFLKNVVMVTLMVASLVYMIDAIEMLRHYVSKDTISTGMAFSLSVLKLPNLIEKVFPFIFLFASMWTFTRLSRTNELVVARASGLSVWEFLLPALVSAIALGLFVIFAFNSASATMLSRYKVLERTMLRGEDSTLNVGRTGLWLREASEGNQRVVHALGVDDTDQENLKVLDVIIFQYEGRHRFDSRVDAREATLSEGAWHLEEAWISRSDGSSDYYETLELRTTLSPKRIQESFASPETLTIWELSEFISRAMAAGFSVNDHRFHWHSLTSTPALFLAMVLLAAVFSLRSSRAGGVMQLVGIGAISGFALFFISDLTGALGQSGLLPPALAAWAPTAITALIGISLLFHLEDG